MVLVFDILETRKAQRLGGGLRENDPTPSGSSAPTEDDYPMWEREADVARCAAVLRRAETRWHIAGRLQYVHYFSLFYLIFFP